MSYKFELIFCLNHQINILGVENLQSNNVFGYNKIGSIAKEKYHVDDSTRSTAPNAFSNGVLFIRFVFLHYSKTKFLNHNFKAVLINFIFRWSTLHTHM